MVLVGIVLAGSILAGWMGGGRVRNLGEVELRGVGFAVAALLLQLLLALLSAVDGPAAELGRVLLAASHVSLLAFVAANRMLPGMGLVLLGFAMNAAVITANGAMPVDPDALVRAGGVPAVEEGKHRLLEEGDPLPWLADVIPLAPLRTVVSAGDVVLAAGVGVLMPSLMRLQPRPPGRRSRPPVQRGRGGGVPGRPARSTEVQRGPDPLEEP